MSRFVEGVVAGWTADPAQGAKAAKQKAIAKQITETETDSVVPAAEGTDAVARNALLPVSMLPVEAARPFIIPAIRSEERRVGKVCVSTCRSRWSPDHYIKHKIQIRTHAD